MKKLVALVAALGVAGAMEVSFSTAAFAHNRAHVILPSGECMIVGSEKSVELPDGTLHDLRPETFPADEIGTAFAADEGRSRLQKGACA